MQNCKSLTKFNIIVISITFTSLLLLASISSMATSVFAAKFIATMSGNNEVPPVDTNASGYTSFRTAVNNTVIKYKVNATGIINATGADLHIGKLGASGDVIVDLLNNAKKNKIRLGMAIRGNITDADLTGPMKGKALAELISAMKNGDTYVNLHTSTHPDGEIRGQIESGSRIGNSNQTATLNMTNTANLNLTNTSNTTQTP